MERLVVAAALAAFATAAAFAIQRGRRSAPRELGGPGPLGPHVLPTAADLSPLSSPGRPTLAVFTEETCETCAHALATARGAAGMGLAVVEVPFGAQRELHRQNRIHTVPTTLLIDSDGCVVDGWIGRVDEDELARAAAQARG